MPTPVRLATPTDIPEIVRVVNLAYRVEDFFIRGDRTDALELRDRFAAPGTVFLVVDAPTPNTLAAAVLFEAREGHGWFGMLAVDPRQAGLGHARALLAAMEARCHALGLSRLVIETVDLREELPAFYTRLGFVVTGTSPFLDSDKLLRPAVMIVMEKALAPTAA